MITRIALLSGLTLFGSAGCMDQAMTDSADNSDLAPPSTPISAAIVSCQFVDGLGIQHATDVELITLCDSQPDSALEQLRLHEEQCSDNFDIELIAPSSPFTMSSAIDFQFEIENALLELGEYSYWVLRIVDEERLPFWLEELTSGRVDSLEEYCPGAEVVPEEVVEPGTML